MAFDEAQGMCPALIEKKEVTYAACSSHLREIGDALQHIAIYTWILNSITSPSCTRPSFLSARSRGVAVVAHGFIVKNTCVRTAFAL